MNKEIEEIKKQCFNGSTQFKYDECSVKYTKALEQKIEQLEKEVERLEQEDRQIIFEISDEQYITLSEKGLQEIKDSAEEFDGFIGGYVIGNVTDLVKENIKLKEAMQWFIDRCDKGEVRSKKTYARFKELLTK